jgi:hypothetical protein
VAIRQLTAFQHAHAVAEESKRSLRGDTRIELAQEPAAALRGLANTFPPVRRASSLIFSNPACGRNTSPRTSRRAEYCRPQLQRDRADGTHVGGNIFAGGAIATGRRLHQHAVFIENTDRQAVQLQLAAVGEVSLLFRRSCTRLLNARKLSSSKTLSSDSIGTSWRIWLKAPSGAAPTRWVANPG